MIEPKTEKNLGFNASGNFIGFSEDLTDTHHDVYGKEYRKCPRCKQWLPVDTWPANGDGKPKKLCANCLEKQVEGQRAAKEAKGEGKDKTVELKQAPQLFIDSKETRLETSHYDLSKVPPQDIIVEMRRRGWKGTVTVTMDFEL